MTTRADEQDRRAVEPDKPRLGSAGRPMVVRGAVMPSTDCLWATCGGSMTAHGRDLHECSSCATWFQLLPPETGFVYVGDLGDDSDQSDVPESERLIIELCIQRGLRSEEALEAVRKLKARLKARIRAGSHARRSSSPRRPENAGGKAEWD